MVINLWEDLQLSIRDNMIELDLSGESAYDNLLEYSCHIRSIGFSEQYLKYRALVSRMLLCRECFRAPVNEIERDTKFSRSDYQKKKALSSLFCS